MATSAAAAGSSRRPHSIASRWCRCAPRLRSARSDPSTDGRSRARAAADGTRAARSPCGRRGARCRPGPARARSRPRSRRHGEAATAAAHPAGPPPTTATSTDRVTDARPTSGRGRRPVAAPIASANRATTSAVQKKPWQRPVSTRVRRRRPSRSTAGSTLAHASRSSPAVTRSQWHTMSPYWHRQRRCAPSSWYGRGRCLTEVGHAHTRNVAPLADVDTCIVQLVARPTRRAPSTR